MQTWHRLAAWAAVLTTVVGLGPSGAGRAAAQGARGPAAGVPSGWPEPPTPQKHYSKGAVLELPVSVEEAERPKLKAVQLFVKQGAGDWQFKQTADPSQQKFKFPVPQEGEYWFTLVTVDRAGNQNPPDVHQEAPMLVVVVDRTPPEVEVQPGRAASGEPLLRCTIKDDNPDYASLKASYQGPDRQWHPLEPLPGARGVFRVPSADVLAGTVRVTAADLARNVTTREVNLRGPAGKQVAAAAGPEAPPAKAAGPAEAENAVPIPPPQPPAEAKAKAPAGASPAHAAPGGERPPLTTPAAEPGTVERTSYTRSARAPAAGAAPPRQVLATTHASLEYRLDQVGPSGVSKVEIYITSDEGKTWQKLCEDPDRRSPADLTLPGEGLFGVRLVVTNGNGFGGTAPGRGDAPTCWIEVDQTPPHAQLHEVDPVVKDGVLDIRWTASDKNLGPEPVSLYYAAKKEGPWLPVARGLRNEGVYHWAFPRDIGGQFFLKLEVVDQAGNVGHCVPANPVVLDMTEPRALVVGVTPVTPRP
jgi:hypothetical protein